MNIFSRIALQSMKKSRSRTIVTVIGVILSAAMITAVAAFGTSLLNFLLNNSIAKYGDWHIEFPDVPLLLSGNGRATKSCQAPPL